MKEQSSKEWTLVLFRKFEDTYFESIDTAKFKFGRTQEEVLENEGEVMSECLISIVKSKNLEDLVMETGFVINFTTINPKNNDYVLLEKILSSSPTFRKFGYSLYTTGEETSPLRFVDLSKVCDQSPMPNKIWIRLRSLTINEISWGIENNLFENLDKNQLKGEQLYLNEFGFNIKKAKKKREKSYSFVPSFPLPGPSEFNYKFLN